MCLGNDKQLVKQTILMNLIYTMNINNFLSNTFSSLVLRLLALSNSCDFVTGEFLLGDRIEG